MRPMTWRLGRLSLAIACMLPAMGHAGVIGFDGDPPGAAPHGWSFGVTGRGQPRWTVAYDAFAPSSPNVLRQSGQGDFPWIVLDDVNIPDGHVEVKFKPLAGQEDQAGGLVWRFKSGDEYYVARANALEDNVSLYYVRKGRRITLKYVDARTFGGNVKPNEWHKLGVEFNGSRITVTLDGRRAIELDDQQISGSGRVGLWTKADSVTAFDDFTYGATGQ